MPRILSVSYDELLLRTRHMLLQHSGYDTVSSLGFTQSLEHCKNGNFDLFILKHSIPYSDKRQLVEESFVMFARRLLFPCGVIPASRLSMAPITTSSRTRNRCSIW